MASMSQEVSTQFYRALEDEYRGTRELVKGRLQVYLPFVLPLVEAYPNLPVFDIGCGRGEFLEMLRDNQVPAYGMDLDINMLKACRENGLQVSQGDAIEYLKTLGERSLLAVSCIHVAEHLPFSVLQTLFAEVRRVLVPGGMLFLETPNPENLVVGTASFYIDPTHQRPLPSQLLLFLAKHHGYAQIKLLRLQEEARLKEGPQGILDVLVGVSPDYAIVAQVSAESQGELGHCPEFSADYGVSLFDLASRYDENLRVQLLARQQEVLASQAQAAEACLQAAEARTQVAEACLQAAAARAQVAEACLQVAAARTQASEARTQAAEARAQAADAHALARTTHDQLLALFSSRSWRLTRPLRWLARQFRSRPGNE